MPASREGLARLVARLGLDERVVSAFRTVAREDFVPPDSRVDAYSDRPIPIPGNQTTSQPTLIALMIDTASIGPRDRVLEVGGGYGFQTALLAELAGEVFSLDRDPQLVAAARQNLGPRAHVHVNVGDGWKGLPDQAPFDAIIVSAAADGLPTALGEQLAEGGRLVIPLKEGGTDDVWLLRRESGELRRIRMVSPARFVPLVKPHEHKE